MATNLQARALGKSLALHGLALTGVLLLPAGPLRTSAHPDEVEVVFHRPPDPIVVPAPKLPAPSTGPIAAGPKMPQPVAPRHAAAPPMSAPVAMETPGLPEGPKDVPVAEPPQAKVGKSGILAFKDQIASLAQDKTTPRLGADARYGAAVDASPSSSRTLYLLNSVPSRSGGIDASSLTRNVGGGGGGSGGGGNMQGLAVGRETSPLAGIGGGGGKALGSGGSGGAGADASGRGGPGAARTDEEIQIVFDRHKASFYRLYHQELRNDPTLKGQIVLRLTIEPDGRVSMCTLQSTDMHAPQLAAEVVDRVREINFGAKEGVAALTIVYPIDFLPAA